MSMSFSACLINSPAKTATVVVPSPTSSSWVFEMSMMILAAGLSTNTDFKIVAPSLVTVKDLRLFGSTDWRILSMPLGPRVVLTRSAMAMAPIKDC